MRIFKAHYIVYILRAPPYHQYGDITVFEDLFCVYLNISLIQMVEVFLFFIAHLDSFLCLPVFPQVVVFVSQ